ncbi:MAG: sodium-dependent bicarbonate transport family permease [Candidatus Sumerlaeia bacterium]|nr:sodium-dependent bicarbonate transport family permease [Candidatus Sumerlaeia bacterium]
MIPFDLLKLNLLSPMVLCFALGAVARALRSDLRLPEVVYTTLSTYLMLAIGLKGGVALGEASLREMALPVLATVILGVGTPLGAFLAAWKLGKLSIADSAALAAHYGSVSVVTFIAALSFLDLAGEPAERYLPALVAILEVPAIFVGLLLAQKASRKEGSLKAAIHEILTGKSVVLLAGGMVIGYATGPVGFERVKPFFADPFQGVLCLFLLDMGLVAASRLGELKKTGKFVVVFGLLTPLVNGALGVALGHVAGLSVGGATALGAMAASASYIAAPAAVRIALPEANPSIYLTAAIGITFPFNLSVGIPIYYRMAQWFAS